MTLSHFAALQLGTEGDWYSAIGHISLTMQCPVGCLPVAAAAGAASVLEVYLEGRPQVGLASGCGAQAVGHSQQVVRLDMSVDKADRHGLECAQQHCRIPLHLRARCHWQVLEWLGHCLLVLAEDMASPAQMLAFCSIPPTARVLWRRMKKTMSRPCWQLCVPRSSGRRSLAPSRRRRWRCAKALRPCASLACPHLAVNPQLRGKTCSGCRAVRYCCTEDQAHDWREGGHRAACRLLCTASGSGSR